MNTSDTKVNSSLLTGLNDKQQQAVTHGFTPLLLLAGAGSGKTKTLTHRIAHLIQTGEAKPWQIMAITFTNKAAAEMRERLDRLLGEDVPYWVTTFHSSGVRMLRQWSKTAWGEKIGLRPDFSIYDDQDQLRVIRDVMARLSISDRTVKPKSVAAAIDQAKNSGLFPQDLSRDNVREEAISSIYDAYQKQLKQANAYDFGDLLLQTVHLLATVEEARTEYRERFKYLLVDEFQDQPRPVSIH